MESLFFELKQILTEQSKTISELLTAAKAHNLALQENDIAAISAAIKQQQALADNLTAQERIREALQIKLAQYFDLPEDITLKQLMNHAPSDKGLSSLAQEMNSNLEQLAAVNQLNNALSNNGMLFLQKFRAILQPAIGTTYQGTGQVRQQRATVSTMNKSI